jgi:hypothetical protein
MQDVPSQTSGIMKTLFRKFGFALLALIAIIVVLAIRGFAQPTATPTPCPEVQDMKLVLRIGGPGPDDFVALKNADAKDFNKALNDLRGQYKIRFKPNQGNAKDCYHPGDHPGGPASIKTDKITTSEVARRAQGEEGAANDPYVTYRVTSNYTQDIINVLNTLNP